MKYASYCFMNLCSRYPEFVLQNIEDFMKLYNLYYENDNIISGLTEALCSKTEFVDKYFLGLWTPLVQKLLVCQQILANQASRSEDLVQVKSSLYSIMDKVTMIV